MPLINVHHTVQTSVLDIRSDREVNNSATAVVKQVRSANVHTYKPRDAVRTSGGSTVDPRLSNIR